MSGLINGRKIEAMSKDSRETYHLLKDGKDFKKRLFKQYMEDGEIEDDRDFDFVLDELKNLSGIEKKE